MVPDRQDAGDSLASSFPTDTLRAIKDVPSELASPVEPSQRELLDELCNDQVKRWRPVSGSRRNRIWRGVRTSRRPVSSRSS